MGYLSGDRDDRSLIGERDRFDLPGRASIRIEGMENTSEAGD
jgi:hypothetical protein